MENNMKKLLAIILTAVMLFSLASCVPFSFDQNGKSDNSSTLPEEFQQPNLNEGEAHCFAAIPVAPQNNQLTVIDSYTDGENNYFLLDAGYIKNVYMSTLAAINYTGVPISSSKTTYSSSEVMQAISTTVVDSYSHTNTHSTHTGIGFEEKIDIKFPFVGKGEIKFNQEFSWDWSGSDTTTNEKSVSNTTETAKTYAEEQTISFSFGYNEVPEGYYRYAMYGTCDVYYIVVTSSDNQTLVSCSISTCARTNEYFIRSEYSADGTFDNTPEEEILFAADFYKTLPIPTNQKPANGTSGLQPTSSYGGGLGTESSPYLIETKEQFIYMVQNCSSSEFYKITSNIDLGNWNSYGIMSWNKNSRTPPKYFTGHLDGNGKEISYKLTISKTTKCSWALGLFPATKDATIKNLSVNSDISTYDSLDRGQKWDIPNDDCATDVMVGGIIGYAINTSLDSCSTEGKVYFNSDGGEEDTCVGGVIGYAYNCPSIYNCQSSADVYARGFWVWVGGVISVSYNTVYGNLSFSGTVDLNNDWVFGGSGKNATIVNSNKQILNLN